MTMGADEDFTLNLGSRPERLIIGREKEPLIVIDNAFQYPEKVVDHAANIARFGSAGAAYPGLRAAVPEFLNRVLFYALQSITHGVFAISDNDEMSMTSSFAMVTLPPEQLSVPQRIPHYDSAAAKDLAVVIYLCEPGWGGTSFYRHCSTGFETVSPERIEPYNRCLASEVEHLPFVPPRIDVSKSFFDRTHAIQARFNRLVLYRSRLLHSADMTPNRGFSEDPQKGRLTITSFLRPLVSPSRGASPHVS